jgi:hypothetical protein
VGGDEAFAKLLFSDDLRHFDGREFSWRMSNPCYIFSAKLMRKWGLRRQYALREGNDIQQGNTMMKPGRAGRGAREWGMGSGRLSISARRRERRRVLADACRRTLDPLERRVLLSGTLIYVNDNWNISMETGAPGLTAGDIVDNTGAGDDGALHDLTLGTNAFATVAEALAVAVPGDRVVVVSGTYGENVTVTGGVAIEGWSNFAAASSAPAANPDLPHVNQAALDTALTTTFSGSHWDINDGNAAESVSILGLNFTAIPEAGALTVQAGERAAVTMAGNNFEFTTLTLTGVKVEAGLTALPIHIWNNVFTGAATSSTFTGGGMAIVAECVTGEIAGNVITQVVDGIKVSRGENLTIGNNTIGALTFGMADLPVAITSDDSGAGVVITGNQLNMLAGRYGIIVANTGAETVAITANTINEANRGSFGIIATSQGSIFGLTDGATAVTVSGNTLTGTVYGIALSGTGMSTLGDPLLVTGTVAGNSLESPENGIFLAGAAQGVVTGNTINAAGIGIDVEADGSALIADNTISYSGTGILFNSEAPGTITRTRFDMGQANRTDIEIAAGGQLVLGGGNYFMASHYIVDNESAWSFLLSGDSFGSFDAATINSRLNGLVTWVYAGVMVGQHVFYGGSSYDVAGGADAAMATDKTALLPGGTATFANYTSYDRGLNGIMVDLNGALSGLTAADFVFKTGNDNSPEGWTVVTEVPTVTVRPGAGVGGSTRVEIRFADGAIRNTWLQVTVRGNEHTDMLKDAVFYFGNAVGESGDSAAGMRVDLVDQLAVRAGGTEGAGITNPLDFNRDGAVDGVDEGMARGNITWFMNEEQLITVPAAVPAFFASGSDVGGIVLAGTSFDTNVADIVNTVQGFNPLLAGGTSTTADASIAGQADMGGPDIAVQTLDSTNVLPMSAVRVGSLDSSVSGAFSLRTVSAALEMSAAATTPTVSNISLSTSSNKAKTFRGSIFSAAFVSPGAGITEVVFTLPAHGTLTLAGVPIQASQRIAFNKLGRLAYRPDKNFAGTDTFTWNASDGTQYATGSSLISIQVIGKAPSVTRVSKGVLQNATAMSFETADFTNSFVEPNVGPEFQSITVYSLPAHGTLTLDGVKVTAGQVIGANDIADLVYRPATGFAGKDSFRWKASDNLRISGGYSLVNLTVIASQTLIVTGNGVIIPTGSSIPSPVDFTDFGYLGQTGNDGHLAADRTFVITNNSTRSINLTGGAQLIRLGGRNYKDFSVSGPIDSISQLPVTSLAAGASATFTITFVPQKTGVRVATVKIPISPGRPFTFNIEASIRSQDLVPVVDSTGFPTSITDDASTELAIPVVITNNSDFPSVGATDIRIIAVDVSSQAQTVLTTLTNQDLGGISAHGSRTLTLHASLPAGFAPGTYKLGVILNSSHGLVESNYSNNMALGSQSVNIGFQDLVPVVDSTGFPASIVCDASTDLAIPVVISNNSDFPSVGTTDIQIIVVDTASGAQVVLTTLTNQDLGGIGAYGSRSLTLHATIPVGFAAGTYELGVVLNASRGLVESNYANNMALGSQSASIAPSWKVVDVTTFSGIGNVSSAGPFTMTGTLRQRLVGPRAENEAAPGGALLMSQENFQLRAALPATDKFAVGGWFMFDQRTRGELDSSHGGVCQFMEFPYNYGGGSHAEFNWNTGSITWYVDGVNASWSHVVKSYTTPVNFYDQWVFVLFARDGDHFQWWYKFADGSLVKAFDVTAPVNPNWSLSDMCIDNNYTNTVTQNLHRWAGRIGMLFRATIGSLNGITEANVDSLCVDPPTTPNTWYVSANADGTGTGTSSSSAWSPAQMVDEVMHGGIIPTRTAWTYTSDDSAVPFNIDATVLMELYNSGAIKHAGDEILIDDCGTDMRIHRWDLDGSADGVLVRPAEGKTAHLNFSSLVTDWTPVDGESRVWKTPCTATYACLWEDGKWLDKVKSADAATIISYCASSTGVSFGFDGTYMYLGTPEGITGHTYELSDTPGGIAITGESISFKDVSVTKNAAFRNIDSYAYMNLPQSVYPFNFTYAGLSIFDGVSASYGDKHCFGVATAATCADGSRTLILNCTASQGAPTSYVGFGGQTAGVLYVDRAHSTSKDNQIIWANWNSVLNAGMVGSATGVSDLNQPGWYTHTSSGRTVPFTLVALENFQSSSTECAANERRCTEAFMVDYASNLGVAWTNASPGEGVSVFGPLTVSNARAEQNVVLNFECPGASSFMVSKDGGPAWVADSPWTDDSAAGGAHSYVVTAYDANGHVLLRGMSTYTGIQVLAAAASVGSLSGGVTVNLALMPTLSEANVDTRADGGAASIVEENGTGGSKAQVATLQMVDVEGSPEAEQKVPWVEGVWYRPSVEPGKPADEMWDLISTSVG